MKNKIITGKDALVKFIFTFEGEFELDGLNNFDNITLYIGDETYSTSSDPTLLYRADANTLILNIGDVTALEAGYYIPTIEGYIASSDAEKVITSPDRNQLGGYVLVV